MMLNLFVKGKAQCEDLKYSITEELMKNAVTILTRNAKTTFSNKHINLGRSKIYLQRELLALGKTRYLSFLSKFFLWACIQYLHLWKGFFLP